MEFLWQLGSFLIGAVAVLVVFAAIAVVRDARARRGAWLALLVLATGVILGWADIILKVGWQYPPIFLAGTVLGLLLGIYIWRWRTT